MTGKKDGLRKQRKKDGLKNGKEDGVKEGKNERWP